MKGCTTCKHYKLEYHPLYEQSFLVCKHPKREDAEWDVEWGWIKDCPYWEGKQEAIK